MKFANPFAPNCLNNIFLKKEASFLFALSIFYVPFPGLQISVLVFLRLLRRCGCCLELWGGVEIPSAEGLHLVFLLRHRHLQGSDKGRLRHSKGSPLVGASTEAPLAIQAEGAATTEEKEPKLNSPSELGEKANGKNTTVYVYGFFSPMSFSTSPLFPLFYSQSDPPPYPSAKLPPAAAVAAAAGVSSSSSPRVRFNLKPINLELRGLHSSSAAAPFLNPLRLRSPSDPMVSFLPPEEEAIAGARTPDGKNPHRASAGVTATATTRVNRRVRFRTR